MVPISVCLHLLHINISMIHNKTTPGSVIGFHSSLISAHGKQIKVDIFQLCGDKTPAWFLPYV